MPFKVWECLSKADETNFYIKQLFFVSFCYECDKIVRAIAHSPALRVRQRNFDKNYCNLAKFHPFTVWVNDAVALCYHHHHQIIIDIPSPNYFPLAHPKITPITTTRAIGPGCSNNGLNDARGNFCRLTRWNILQGNINDSILIEVRVSVCVCDKRAVIWHATKIFSRLIFFLHEMMLQQIIISRRYGISSWAMSQLHSFWWTRGIKIYGDVTFWEAQQLVLKEA